MTDHSSVVQTCLGAVIIAFVVSVASITKTGVYIRTTFARWRQPEVELRGSYRAAGSSSLQTHSVRAAWAQFLGHVGDHSLLLFFALPLCGFNYYTAGYVLDKTTISNSSIYAVPTNENTTVSSIKFCHILQLTAPATQHYPELIISEHKKPFTLNIDLLNEFGFGFEPPRLRMTILGYVTISVPLPETQKEVDDLISWFEEASPALGWPDPARDIISVDVINTTEHHPENHTLVSMFVVEEDCVNVTYCHEMLNTTTMYDDFAAYMIGEWLNHDWSLALHEVIAFHTRLPSCPGRNLLGVEGSMISSVSFAAPAVTSEAEEGDEEEDKKDNEDREQDKGNDTPENLHADTTEAQLSELDRKLSPDPNSTEPTLMPYDYDVIYVRFGDPQYEIIQTRMNVSGGDAGSSGGSVEATQDFSDLVTACKCDSAQSFGCVDDDLSPNGELVVCVRSLSPDVKIDYLDSMRIQQGDTDLPVIRNDQVEYPAFTYREYVPGANGVAVSTRAPSNVFNFAAGESIAVSGGIVMRLVGSGERRMLQLDFRSVGVVEKEEEAGGYGTRELQDSGANAGFRLDVDLAEAEDGETVPVAVVNAANGVANGGFVVLGMMVFSCAFAMM